MTSKISYLANFRLKQKRKLFHQKLGGYSGKNLNRVKKDSQKVKKCSSPHEVTKKNT